MAANGAPRNLAVLRCCRVPGRFPHRAEMRITLPGIESVSWHRDSSGPFDSSTLCRAEHCRR